MERFKTGIAQNHDSTTTQETDRDSNEETEMGRYRTEGQLLPGGAVMGAATRIECGERGHGAE